VTFTSDRDKSAAPQASLCDFTAVSSLSRWLRFALKRGAGERTFECRSGRMIEAEEALAGVPWVSPDDFCVHGCRKGRGVGFVGECAMDFRLAPPCTIVMA